MADETPESENAPTVYDHASCDDAEKANEHNTEAWIKASKDAAKSDKK